MIGTEERPRLSVFRSNWVIYAQLIDDQKSHTLVFATEKELAGKAKGKTKTERATLVGELLANKAKEHNIKKAVFNKGNYKYHGRVKALAEGARKGGLQF